MQGLGLPHRVTARELLNSAVAPVETSCGPTPTTFCDQAEMYSVSYVCPTLVTVFDEKQTHLVAQE